MGIAVLGPLQVDGRAAGLSPRDRVVLSALVVRAGDGCSTEVLADALWGESQPASWAKVVHGCVSRLRKQLGTSAIESGSAGYRLVVNEVEVDARAFERRLGRAHEALDGGDPERASYLVEEALALWRGRALTDVEEWEPGRVEAARLEGLRMEAEELFVEARTNAGHGAAVVESARSLVAQAPFRERRWCLLAMALHQAGRQAEALAALRRARTMLGNELGLDPGPELARLEELLLRGDPSLDPVEGREVSGACPYRGLLPYDATDADAFFGREVDVEACLRKLRDVGVLAVVGPSGVGKSSLVRAGVVAALLRDGVPVLLTTPGIRPTESLQGLELRRRQTLVVDQAEEAVTLCTDPGERERYFAALSAHVGAGGRLVLSIRTDHLNDLAPFPGFARFVEDGLYLLGPMSEPDLRQAIEGPARRAGLRLEPGLVDLLVREVEGEPSALPMLSHVLRGTWEHREGPTLTVDGYRATGGIRSAVSQTAETLYDDLEPPQRDQLRALLLRLVVPTEDGEPVRARVPRTRVVADDAHEELVERLVRARLVSTDGDTLQIAHEALVRGWPRLRGWLEDDVDGQRVFRHLAGAAEAWDAMGRPESELYRGARLSRALEWRDRASPALSGAERSYLDASAALAESELRVAQSRVRAERGVNRRLRAALAGVVVLLALSLVAGFVAWDRAGQARRERLRAEGLADAAQEAAGTAAALAASAQAVGEGDLATALLVHLAALEADDTSAQLWEDLATTLVRAGPLLRTRLPTGADAMSVASDVSSDGTLVASSNPVDGVQLYDAETLSPVPFEDATPSSIVRFSPDGRYLAAAVNQWTGTGGARIHDLPVRLYDLPSGTLSERQLGGWPEDSNVEYHLAFSSDGRRIAAGVNRWDAIRLTWRPVAAAMVWDLRHPEKPIFRTATGDNPAVTLSPDGTRVYVVSPGRNPVQVYDVDTGRLVASTRRPLPDPSDLAVSPDGRLVAVAVGAHVEILDGRTLRDAGITLRGATGGNVEFSHDGTKLLTVSESGAALWDLATGDLVQRLATRGAWDVRFGPGDTRIHVTGFGVLQTWDLHEAFLTSGAAALRSGGLSLSLPAPDGRTVARRAGTKVWFTDNVTGRTTPRVRWGPDVSAARWSPDSRWLAATSAETLVLWDAPTGQRVGQRSFTPGHDVLAVWSPDSALIHVIDGQGFIRTLDRATLEPARAPVVVGDVRTMTSLPDGDLLVLTVAGSLVVIDADTDERVRRSRAGLIRVDDYEEGDPLGTVSPDGTLLVARHPDGALRLLRLDTFEWMASSGPPGWGGDVAFAPDGSQFATVVAGQVRIHDGRTGELQASVPLPAGVGEAGLVYRPRGSELLVSSLDGDVWTLDTRLETWLDRACAIAGRNLTSAEWEAWFPDRPYQVTCPEFPAGE